MRSIHRLGSLIVRLTGAIKACSVGGDPKKDALSGKPGQDFLRGETVMELEMLFGSDGSLGTYNAIAVVHALPSRDWNAMPDFGAVRAALNTFKWVAKLEQRKLIDEAYAAAGMVNDHPKAHNEELIPRLEERHERLVGSVKSLGLIPITALRCAKLSRRLGENEEFVVGDLKSRSFVEIVGIYRMLTTELDSLAASERKATVARLDALRREQKTPHDQARRSGRTPRPQTKTSEL